MSLSTKEIKDLNRMNTAAQNSVLGTLLSGLESNSSGSYSGSTVYNALLAHAVLSGSDAHRLGNISVQSASSVNIIGGNISGVGFARTNVSASSLTYTVLETDFTVRCNATSGSIGIFLRPATNSGRIHNIKNLYTSTCLVVVYGDTTGTPDLIDGQSSQTLSVKSNMTVQDNAVNFWDIL